MKISGVNISGGIKINTTIVPTPAGPSKFVTGAWGYDSSKGAVYVYNTDGTGEQKITTSDGASGDRFGGSVAITDTKVVVGANGDDSFKGAAYIYDTDGTGELKITASDGAQNDGFGRSVAITDTKVVVGASGNDDSGSNSGSVYVYNLDGSGEQKITASDSAAGDEFGIAVAMTDTKIVVSAEGDDDRGSVSGSVYVYNLDGTGELKITASDGATSDKFGNAVAMTDTHVAVGASGDTMARGSAYVYNTDGTGEVKITSSIGTMNDLFGWSVAMSDTKVVVGAIGNGDKGAAYIYNLDGTGEVKIQASDGASGDRFGESVAITDTKVVVGALRDDDSGSNSGSVYVYNLDGTGEVKITASDGVADDQFGNSIAAN